MAALQAYNAMSEVDRTIGKHLLTLSTGKRINAVSNDAAGFSLARSLEARRGSLSQALENVGIASSVLSIAEGGYLAIAELLQSLKELVVQGADDSHGGEQRNAIQGQIDALVAEIDAIVAETQFGATQLINGAFTGKKFQTGAAAGDVIIVSMENADSAVLFTALGLVEVVEEVVEDVVVSEFTIPTPGTDDVIHFQESGVFIHAFISAATYTGASLAIELAQEMNAAGGSNQYAVSFDDATIKFTIEKISGPDTFALNWTHISNGGNIADLLGFDTASDDTGATSYISDSPAPGTPVTTQVTTSVTTLVEAEVSVDLSVANSTVASEAIDSVDGAINRLNGFAQTVGEFLVRFSSKEDTLSVAILNIEATRSRIEDADFALEQMELVRAQIVQQTSYSAFAQANAVPELVLSLFR